MRDVPQSDRVEIFIAAPTSLPAGAEQITDPCEAASAVSAQVDQMAHHDPYLTDILVRENLRQAWIEAARSAATNGGAVIKFAGDSL